MNIHNLWDLKCKILGKYSYVGQEFLSGDIEDMLNVLNCSFKKIF